MAIINDEDRIITGREFPQLVRLQTQPTEDGFDVWWNGKRVGTIENQPDRVQMKTVAFFSRSREAAVIESEFTTWLSNFLGIECRLVRYERSFKNAVLPRHGGTDFDEVALADQCPILLVSQASLAELNGKLDAPAVGMRNFRPNVVINGSEAGVEDTWKRIRIGVCTFRVAQPCVRCVFTTIDPEAGRKREDREPLKTLQTYRRDPRGGVKFGVHLIPEQLGTLRVNDPLEVLERY